MMSVELQVGANLTWKKPDLRSLDFFFYGEKTSEKISLSLSLSFSVNPPIPGIKKGSRAEKFVINLMSGGSATTESTIGAWSSWRHLKRVDIGGMLPVQQIRQ